MKTAIKTKRQRSKRCAPLAGSVIRAPKHEGWWWWRDPKACNAEEREWHPLRVFRFGSTNGGPDLRTRNGMCPRLFAKGCADQRATYKWRGQWWSIPLAPPSLNTEDQRTGA